MLQKTITVKEYAEQQGKTKEAIFYQIKKGKIQAQKNRDNEREIILEEQVEESPKIKSDFHELEAKIQLLTQELELKNQIIQDKKDIIESQKKTIEAEQRTSMALVKTCELLESKEKILLLENETIKKEKEELSQQSKKGFFQRLF